MSNNPVVTIIPATIHLGQKPGQTTTRKKRVAAYARVSTDNHEQLTSYEAQVDHYTDHIKSNPDWEFVKVYSDEGLSGTSTIKREGFKQMVADALNGNIDLILTKSISRFARNTVDSIQTVRSLKDKGVEVYFEKENIHTLDSKGELLLTIMSSLAQEESRSISENVRWGKHKQMQNGKVSMPYKQFLGYEKGPDGKPKIVENEAKVVKQIYTLFLEGATYREIAANLTANNVPTPSGKEVWYVSTIKSILQNEKYAGNAILQKKYTVDFLSKKKLVNQGQLPQYYVENSHPGIIPLSTYELVQDEIRRREKMGKSVRSKLFTGQIICGECGALYRPKVWHSKDKYRRTIWRCNARYGQKGSRGCHTPHLTEEALKNASQRAWATLLADKEHYIKHCESQLISLADDTTFNKQVAMLTAECVEAATLMEENIAANATKAPNRTEQYNELEAKYDIANAQLEALKQDKLDRMAYKEKIQRFLRRLHEYESDAYEFSEKLWRETIESTTVYSTEDIVVRFWGDVDVRIDFRE